MSPFDDKQIAAVGELLSEQRKIVIITHFNPDGDAMGSSLGLFHFLRAEGHLVNVIVPNPYPEFLQWMPMQEQVVIFTQQAEHAAQLLQQADVLFVLDFNAPSRCGDIEPLLLAANATKIMIDHHPMPEYFTHYRLSVTENVSSTAELVFDFIEAINRKHNITAESAQCLFTGIITDTGSFNHNASHPRLYRTVAQLIAAGADKDTITANLNNGFSADRMRLFGLCLYERMEVIPQYRTSLMVLSKEDISKFHFKQGDTEGFVNVPLGIRDVVMSAFFIEDNDRIKISLRSRGNFDVNHMARAYFNGGGHKNAAGGRTFVSLADTIALFKSILPQYEAQLKEA